MSSSRPRPAVYRASCSIVSALLLTACLLCLLEGCGRAQAKPFVGLLLYPFLETSVNSSTSLATTLVAQKLQQKLDTLAILSQAFALSGNVTIG